MSRIFRLFRVNIQLFYRVNVVLFVVSLTCSNKNLFCQSASLFEWPSGKYSSTNVDFQVAPFANGYYVYFENGKAGLKNTLNHTDYKTNYKYIVLSGALFSMVVQESAIGIPLEVNKDFWTRTFVLHDQHFGIAYDGKDVFYINKKGEQLTDSVYLNDEIVLMYSYCINRSKKCLTQEKGIETLIYDGNNELVGYRGISQESISEFHTYKYFDEYGRTLFERTEKWPQYALVLSRTPGKQAKYYKYNNNLQSYPNSIIYYKDILFQIDTIELLDSKTFPFRYDKEKESNIQVKSTLNLIANRGIQSMSFKFDLPLPSYSIWNLKVFLDSSTTRYILYDQNKQIIFGFDLIDKVCSEDEFKKKIHHYDSTKRVNYIYDKDTSKAIAVEFKYMVDTIVQADYSSRFIELKDQQAVLVKYKEKYYFVKL